MEEPNDAATPSQHASSGNAPELQAVAEALSACVRESLGAGQAVAVPGMGRFRVEHEPSQMNRQDGGGLSVSPPRDTAVFEPAGS